MHLAQHWERQITTVTPVVITPDYESHRLGTCIMAWNHGTVSTTLAIETSDDGVTWFALSLDGSATGVMAGGSGFAGLFFAGAFKYVRMSLSVAIPQGVSVYLTQFARPSAAL